MRPVTVTVAFTALSAVPVPPRHPQAAADPYGGWAGSVGQTSAVTVEARRQC
jgi:hypothetical protein